MDKHNLLVINLFIHIYVYLVFRSCLKNLKTEVSPQLWYITLTILTILSKYSETLLWHWWKTPARMHTHTHRYINIQWSNSLSVTFLTGMPSYTAILLLRAFQTPLCLCSAFQILEVACFLCLLLIWPCWRRHFIKSMKNLMIQLIQLKIQFTEEISSVLALKWNNYNKFHTKEHTAPSCTVFLGP